MSRDEVVKLMESSQTQEEWNGNCDKVKKACNGYPDFWFVAVISSGLAGRVMANFGGDDRVRIMRLEER